MEPDFCDVRESNSRERQHPMNRHEWTWVADLVAILKIYETATVALSSSTEVTVSSIFPFIKLLEQNVSHDIYIRQQIIKG